MAVNTVHMPRFTYEETENLWDPKGQSLAVRRVEAPLHLISRVFYRIAVNIYSLSSELSWSRQHLDRVSLTVKS